jgi:hypothetical protein
MTNPNYPLVRPARAASGGVANAPFGNSGAPGVPTRGARGPDLGEDDGRGRFTERVFVFPPFPDISPNGDEQSSQIEVTANRGKKMRMVGLRAVITKASNPTTFDAALMKLRLQINGNEDFTTSGQRVQPVSFAILFANIAAPWWWYAAPPQLKAGDQLQVTITNTSPPAGESSNIMNAEIGVRLVDEAYWLALYGDG